MGNTFLTPNIIAREALMVLRNNAVMANLVHRDYSDEFANGVGDTITIRKPAIVVWVSRIVEGQKCQLRTAMLSTYYHCKDKEQIRQYERENFDKLYAAYKKLRGNSFVDDIYKEIRSYEVIT